MLANGEVHPVQRLSPHNRRSVARAFVDRWRGLQAEIAQLALTVILKLVISCLTSVISIVLHTVNLQFRVCLLPFSWGQFSELWQLMSSAIGCRIVHFSLCWFRCLSDSSQDMAQNIIYSPWEGTQGPWLCLMTKLLLFGLLWLFSFVFACSHFLD